MKRSVSRSRQFCLLLSTIAVVTVAQEASATTSYPQCTQLGTEITEDMCLHATVGEFGDGVQPYPLTASAVDSFAAPEPNVNGEHTFYAVNLPAGSPGAYVGTLKYLATETGDFAVYVTPDPPVPAPPLGSSAPPPPPPPRPAVPIQILAPDGSTVPIELHESPTACDRVPAAFVVHMTAGVTYRIRTGPSPVATVGFIVENLAEHEAPHFLDSDGDGYGNAAVSLLTPCVPPANYVSDDTDCNDARSTVHPLAAEICDKLDNNCDGNADEGLQCAVAVPATPVGFWALVLASLMLVGAVGVWRRHEA